MAKPPPRGPKTLDHKTRGWLFLTFKSCVQYLSSLFLGLNQGGSLSVPTITPVDLQKSTGMGGGCLRSWLVTSVRKNKALSAWVQS